MLKNNIQPGRVYSFCNLGQYSTFNGNYKITATYFDATT